MKLKWAEVLCTVGQRLFHALHDRAQVELVAGLVINLEIDTVPTIAPYLVARGLYRIDVQHGGVHLVMEVATAVLYPLLLKISRSDGNLIFARADDCVIVDPVGIEADAVVLARRNIIELGQPPYFFQAMLVAGA